MNNYIMAWSIQPVEVAYANDLFPTACHRNSCLHDGRSLRFLRKTSYFKKGEASMTKLSEKMPTDNRIAANNIRERMYR